MNLIDGLNPKQFFSFILLFFGLIYDPNQNNFNPTRRLTLIQDIKYKNRYTETNPFYLKINFE